MEDSKKNKQRRVLTDDELEQVSGGVQSNGGPYCDGKSKDQCLASACYWSEKLSRCFYNETDAANEEAKKRTGTRRVKFDINTA